MKSIVWHAFIFVNLVITVLTLGFQKFNVFPEGEFMLGLVIGTVSLAYYLLLALKVLGRRS